jgi:hypothetical protein
VQHDRTTFGCTGEAAGAPGRDGTALEDPCDGTGVED